MDKFEARRFLVRPLQRADMQAVLRIQAECYTQIVPESLQSLWAKVAASPRTCFLAEADAGALGYLIGVPVLYPQLPALDAASFVPTPGADTLYLHDLAVAGSGRGSGAARALVQAALAAAQDTGLRDACLVAIQDSVAYWRRYGFTPVEPVAESVAIKLFSYGAGARLMRLQAPSYRGGAG